MMRYVVVMGSSHAHGALYMKNALNRLHNTKHSCVYRASRIYRNSGAHTFYNHLFYNCALAVKTTLEPHTFYRELFMLEHILGRVRSYRNAPRTIDIDVLLSLDLEYTSDHFFVPHRQLEERNFFVIPAIEALKSARWPVPVQLFNHSLKFGSAYLQPFTYYSGG